MSGAARPRPRVAIVVVNYRTAQITCECLDAVAKYVAAGTCEVIVVDNASGDGSAETIRCRHPQAVLIEEARNLGFGEGNNRGVAVATAPYVVLLNSDAILGMDTPNRLVDHLAAHPEVGCVGPRVNLPDGTRQPRIRGHRPSPRRAILQSLGLSRLSPLWHGLDGIDCEGRAEPIAPVGWISGVCMAMRTSDYRAIGGFDAAFFMYCEDIDLCLRMQQHGGKIVHVDDWPLVHLGGASSRPIAKRLRNAVWQQRNVLDIIRRHHGRAWALFTRLGMAPGQVLRLAAGLLRLRADERYLLRSSWVRLLDLLGALRRLPE